MWGRFCVVPPEFCNTSGVAILCSTLRNSRTGFLMLTVRYSPRETLRILNVSHRPFAVMDSFFKVNVKHGHLIVSL